MRAAAVKPARGRRYFARRGAIFRQGSGGGEGGGFGALPVSLGGGRAISRHGCGRAGGSGGALALGDAAAEPESGGGGWATLRQGRGASQPESATPASALATKTARRRRIASRSIASSSSATGRSVPRPARSVKDPRKGSAGRSRRENVGP